MDLSPARYSLKPALSVFKLKQRVSDGGAQMSAQALACGPHVWHYALHSGVSLIGQLLDQEECL